MDMVRDGFTLPVMGYTGPKAMEFKVHYIRQFNAMEDHIRQQLVASALPDFSKPVKRRPCMADDPLVPRLDRGYCRPPPPAAARGGPRDHHRR